MMAASLAHAAANNWVVSVSIVDDAGILLYLDRVDGAVPMSSEVSFRKARTAALTRLASKVWEDRIKERPVFLKFPDTLPIQGGLPIMYEGQCVGAIGVSGVQSFEDEQIAAAGIAAL